MTIVLFMVEFSVNTKWVKIVGNVVQFFCILTGFLSACSIGCLERSAEVSKQNCGVFVFSAVSFCFMYFEALLMGTEKFS